MAMQVRVVCPEELVYEGEAAFVVVPTSDGEFGILARHASEICTLERGYVRICDDDPGTVSHTVAVNDGYVQVADDEVIILATRACDMAEVDADETRARLASLEKRLAALPEDDPDRAYIEREASWAHLMLKDE